MTLDLATLRNSDGQKTTELDVPELGDTLRIRMMSGTDMFKLGERQTKHPNDTDSHARLIFVACIVDGDDKPMFNGTTVTYLMDKPASIITRLISEITEFCGLTEHSEDAVKNSEPTPA